MRGEREENTELCRSVFRAGTEPDREEFAKAMARVIALLEGGAFTEQGRKDDERQKKRKTAADREDG